jgi:hypothetical protein
VSQDELDILFAAIQRDFFPEWVRVAQGSAQLAGAMSCRNNSGDRNLKRQAICLDERPFADIPMDGQRGLLVHKICHDFADRHDVRWAQKMAYCGKRADGLLLPDTAEVIRSDIFSYCGGEIYRIAVGSKWKRPLG